MGKSNMKQSPGKLSSGVQAQHQAAAQVLPESLLPTYPHMTQASCWRSLRTLLLILPHLLHCPVGQASATACLDGRQPAHCTAAQIEPPQGPSSHHTDNGIQDPPLLAPDAPTSGAQPSLLAAPQILTWLPPLWDSDATPGSLPVIIPSSLEPSAAPR